jgi:hypothetical protein
MLPTEFYIQTDVYIKQVRWFSAFTIDITTNLRRHSASSFWHITKHFLAHHETFCGTTRNIFWHITKHFLAQHETFYGTSRNIFWHIAKHFLAQHETFSGTTRNIFWHNTKHFLAHHETAATLRDVTFTEYHIVNACVIHVHYAAKRAETCRI